jgi:hypothetical protein
MGQSSMKASGDREYLSSGRWKCDKSPSGAHYWIIHTYQMTCKYCDERKLASATNFNWPKPELRKSVQKSTGATLISPSQNL